MKPQLAKFSIGQIIHHKLFNYRGVIFDVDPSFQGSEEWYRVMAPSNPPKDQPWYYILVHDTDYHTYVAERNLELDPNQDPITHPDLDAYFSEFKDGVYIAQRRGN